MLQQCYVVNVRIDLPADCCVWNYRPLETRFANNHGVRNYRFMHLNSLFARIKYNSNMAAYYYAE